LPGLGAVRGGAVAVGSAAGLSRTDGGISVHSTSMSYRGPAAAAGMSQHVQRMLFKSVTVGYSDFTSPGLEDEEPEFERLGISDGEQVREVHAGQRISRGRAIGDCEVGRGPDQKARGTDL